MCALPIPAVPDRRDARPVPPGDGQLYACGLFAWAGDQTAARRLLPLRSTGKPMHLPIGLHATKDRPVDHLHRAARPLICHRSVALLSEDVGTRSVPRITAPSTSTRSLSP